ncbi:RNase H family protein [Prescottella subtropica]|uniref:RNase H family protein n=1 Tax=Prescottella subtropica TaxID=2545757 RepID=UPI0010F68417|nr:RNase H family protein [Prescottella subtropica]
MLAAIHLRRNQSSVSGPVDLSRAVAAWTDHADTRTHLFTRDTATDTALYGTGLDAFTLLLDVAAAASEPILLHVTDNTLRKEIAAVVDAFPSVTLVDVARGTFLDLTRTALTVLDADDRARATDLAEHELARIAALPELTVATDASKSRRRGVGVACVSEDGVRHQMMVPDVTTVLEGELLAIELAVARFPGRRLHILTDSQASLQHLGLLDTDWALHATGGVKAVVSRLHDVLRKREIRLSWVRGHNGHLLNETADRLALATRRAFEARIPDATRRAIADRIVEPLRSAA